MAVQQRATGVSGVDGGVGLNHFWNGEITGTATNGAAYGANDAAGHGEGLSEGCADGHGQLPHEYIVAVAQVNGYQTSLRVDQLQDGQVRIFVAAQDLGQHLCPVRKYHRNHLSPVHDVLVGDYAAFVVPHKAGPFAPLQEVIGDTGDIGELPGPVITFQALDNLDIHHRRQGLPVDVDHDPFLGCDQLVRRAVPD